MSARPTDDPSRSFVVHGATRTGKSQLVVARATAILRASGSASVTVAIAAPSKARAEQLEQRLARALSRAAAPIDAARDRGRAAPHTARVGSLIELVTPLVRAHAHDLCVEADFHVLGHTAAGALAAQCIESWIHDAMAAPGPGLTRMLRRHALGKSAVEPLAMIRAAAHRRIATRAFPGLLHRGAVDRAVELTRALEALDDVADLAPRGPAESWLTRSLEQIARARDSVRSAIAGGGGRDADWDLCEGVLGQLLSERLWGWSGSGAWFDRSTSLTRDEVIARREAARMRVCEGLARVDSELAAILHEELAACVRRYEAALARHGALDEVDVTRFAQRLLADRVALTPLGEEGRPFHLLVDDHDALPPSVADLAQLLAEATHRAGGTFFVTCDQARERALARRTTLHELAGAELVVLDAPASLDSDLSSLVSSLVARHPDGGTGSPLEREPERARRQPSVVALPIPRPYSDYGRLHVEAIEASLPEAIAAFVAWLPTSGWVVREHDDDGAEVTVPVATHHVAILFPPRGPGVEDPMGDCARALADRDIATVVPGGRSLLRTEVGRALRAAVSVCAWPDDELALYALLRGPFVALDDEQLFAYRHVAGSLAPWADAPAALDATTAPVADALALVAELVDAATQRGAAAALRMFVVRTRALAQVTLWATGTAASEHLREALDWIERAAAMGDPAPRAVLARLDAATTCEPAAYDASRERGVLLAPLASALGMSFPVVLVADPTASPMEAASPHFVDRRRGIWAEPIAGLAPHELSPTEDEGATRVDRHRWLALYDALSRARDLLVVPYCGDGAVAGWLESLGPLVEPRAPRSERLAPSCPPFGHDSVLERPARARRTGSSTIRPGLHRAKVGDHSIVFWDPAALPPAPVSTDALRDAQLLVAHEGEAAKESAAAFKEWSARAERARRSGEVRADAARSGPLAAESDVVIPIERSEVTIAASVPVADAIDEACAAAATMLPSLRDPTLASIAVDRGARAWVDALVLDAAMAIVDKILVAATTSEAPAALVQRAPSFRLGDGSSCTVDIAFADDSQRFTLVVVAPAEEAALAEASLRRCAAAARRAGATVRALRLVAVSRSSAPAAQPIAIPS